MIHLYLKIYKILLHCVNISLDINIFIRTGCENICGIAPQCDEKNVIEIDDFGDKRCIVDERKGLKDEIDERMSY